MALPGADIVTQAIWRSTRQLAVSVWLPVALLCLWWYLSRDNTSTYFPSLSKILSTIWRDLSNGRLFSDLLYSGRNLCLGLVSATILAIALGILIGTSRRLLEIVDPVIQFGRALPQVALIPVVIGVLGIGTAPKVYLIAFSCFWPILLNAIDGVRGIDPIRLDVARAYRVPLRVRLFGLMLPAASPQIAVGVRVALALGVIVMVFSEMYGATEGIGYYILSSSFSFKIPEVWAGTIVIGCIGYALSAASIAIERRALDWYYKSTAG